MKTKIAYAIILIVSLPSISFSSNPLQQDYQDLKVLIGDSSFYSSYTAFTVNASDDIEMKLKAHYLFASHLYITNNSKGASKVLTEAIYETRIHGLTELLGYEYALLGHIFRKMALHQLAIESYEKAHEIAPNTIGQNPDFLYGFGVASYETSNYTEAKEYFEQLSLKGSAEHDFLAHMFLGLVLSSTKAYEASMQEYQIAFRLAKSPYDSAMLYHNIGLLEKVQNNLEPAEQKFKEALTLKIDKLPRQTASQHKTALELVEVLLLQGNVSKAIAFGNQGLANPGQSSAYFDLLRTVAKAYHKNGDLKRSNELLLSYAKNSISIAQHKEILKKEAKFFRASLNEKEAEANYALVLQSRAAKARKRHIISVAILSGIAILLFGLQQLNKNKKRSRVINKGLQRYQQLED